MIVRVIMIIKKLIIYYIYPLKSTWVTESILIKKLQLSKINEYKNQMMNLICNDLNKGNLIGFNKKI